MIINGHSLKIEEFRLIGFYECFEQLIYFDISPTKCYFEEICTNKNERDRIMVIFCRENDDLSFCVLHASSLHNAIFYPFPFLLTLRVLSMDLLFVRSLYECTFRSFFFSKCSFFDLSMYVFSLYHSIIIFYSDAYHPT